MKRDEQSPNERIARLGEQLIQVLEHEEDHAVVLSALALVTAAVAVHWRATVPASWRKWRRDLFARLEASSLETWP